MEKRGVRRKPFSEKGALELSIGTIVILVIAMAMLIGGLIFIRQIWETSTNAISSIDKGVEDEINKLFSDSDAKISVYPSSRKIEIKQRTFGEGFAFSVRNVDLEDKEFTYTVEVDPNFDIQEKCRIDNQEANNWLDIDSGSFVLARSSQMERADIPLVTYSIPDNAPACTIPYRIVVNDETGVYTSGKVFLTVVAR